jgi:hypothetical protein
MLLSLYNITDASGNPSSLTSILPGGTTGVVTSGTTPIPFLGSPRVEQIVREILDTTQSIGGTSGNVATPAAIGNVLALVSNIATNTGASYWAIPNANLGYGAAASLGDLQYGVVLKNGSTIAIDENPVGSGVGATVVVEGPIQALCVAPTAGGAIAPGTLLCSDGTGNLEPFQPPSAAPTPTVTPVGTTGSTSYSYALVAVSINGTYSAIGTAGSTTTGNATLSGANYNLITWTPVVDAVSYIIVRTVGGATQGAIAIVTASDASFADVGIAAQTGTTATQPFLRPATPSAPTVAQVTGATAGSTSYAYKITAIAANGVWSAESSATTLSTGNATLSVANANKITWTAVAGATYYAIDRTTAGGTPSTTGFIGYATAAQATAGFIDYGIAATTFTAITTPTPTPVAGATLATSLGTLASGTTTPTLTWVYVASR